MSHPIHRFVITGGPCSGKTTGLATIQQRLTNMGYQVLVCPETATMAIQAGVTPTDIGNIIFQGMIIEVQMQHERAFVNIAKLMAENGPVVILHDRGLMDGKAYVEDIVWEAIVEQNYNESQLRDQYDAVIHLVTAANGAEDFYTLENNAARKETPEQARALDEETQRAWLGHPHFRVVDNSTDFKTKIGRAMEHITKLLGIPAPVESERKFLLDSTMDQFCARMQSLGIPSVSVDITQHYLSTGDHEERLRKRKASTGSTYFHTIKKAIPGDPLRRIEVESSITFQDYMKRLEGAPSDLKKIQKTRICFLVDGIYHEVDFFVEPQHANGLGILEVETEDMGFTPSVALFGQCREVTEDMNYRNSSIASA